MQIRTAVPADLQGIVNIEAECFPAAEAATEASLSGRLAFYPNHFWVQLDGDRMIGLSTAWSQMNLTSGMRCMKMLLYTTKTVRGR